VSLWRKALGKEGENSNETSIYNQFETRDPDQHTVAAR
jgi:hypothetical protein